MKGAVEIEFSGNTVEKKHKIKSTFENESKFWKIAMELGVAPEAEFLAIDEGPYVGSIKTSKMTILNEFPFDYRVNTKVKIARKIAKKLLLLTEHKIAHRDVHIKNIVVDESFDPFLIDWEFATFTESDISYDIYGEEKSGTPRPMQHKKLSAIYWDFKGGRSLGSYLIPFSSVKGLL